VIDNTKIEEGMKNELCVLYVTLHTYHATHISRDTHITRHDTHHPTHIHATHIHATIHTTSQPTFIEHIHRTHTHDTYTRNIHANIHATHTRETYMQHT
jgi:hypothetical protein